MQKPIQHTKLAYNYSECRDYLQTKFNYNERDYSDRSSWHAKILKAANEICGDDSWYRMTFLEMNDKQRAAAEFYQIEKLTNPEPEYQNFWHFINHYVEIHNGCYFTMSSEWLLDKNITKWQKEILSHYLDEFGTCNEEEDCKQIEFWISW